MFKPELYKKSNTVPTIDAVESLSKYATRLQWKENESVIDLGCGDGALTAYTLKKYIHPNYKRIVGSDVSEKMVQFANEHHSNDKITFRVLDIGGEVPDELRDGFDHAFSFYALHWIGNQEKVFRNVHNLLKEGGDCLLVFPAVTPVHDFYRALSRRPKWKYLLRDVESFVSPYHDSKAPEKQARGLMAKIGFNNIEVTCQEKFYVNDLDLFKTTMEAINPFVIPSDLQAEFMEDYMEVVRGMEIVSWEGGEWRVRIQYRLLVIYGVK